MKEDNLRNTIRPGALRLDPTCSTMRTFGRHGSTFIRKFVKKANTYYAWAYILGGPVEAKRFTASVNVVLGSKTVISWPSRVFPLDAKEADIIAGGDRDCLHMTKAQVKKCLEPNEEAGGEEEQSKNWRLTIEYDIKAKE